MEKSAERRQKKKSRRSADIFSRAYSIAAALIFHLSQTYDDPTP